MNQSFPLSRPPERVVPFHKERGQMVRHFTPGWFAVTMGTGILSVALAQFPALPVLFLAGRGLWLLNIALFAGFSLIYATRWLIYPREAAQVFGHALVSLFFGCIPMGLATIINGCLIYGTAVAGQVAFGLWWLDVALSVACGAGIPFLMFTRQNHAVETLSGVWLLPIVACEVASVSGGMLLPHIADPATQLSVLLVSYALWALSVPLAMSILALLFLRMAVHKLPPADLAASSWLSLGPIGTGALSMFTLYRTAPCVLEANGLGAFAPIAGDAGLFGGILLWGYGLWWMATATLITLRYLRAGSIPFNMGWWGYIFPPGVYAVATLKLSGIVPLAGVFWFGAALVTMLAALWLMIAARTLRGACDRSLFLDPALAKG